MMSAKLDPERIIYTAKTRTTGGREHGASRSSDGVLDVRLANPCAIRIGTNPEQLFAAGWSASFESAIAVAARNSKIALGEITIDAEVDLHLGTDYFLSARLIISIQGVDHAVAQELVRRAEHLCPYTRATRGNINVTLNVL
jgi:Ohr subfamily peroxiredoxin